MRYRLLMFSLTAAFAMAAAASAQQWPDPPPPAPKAKQKAKQPPIDDTQELSPAQIERAKKFDTFDDPDMPKAVKRKEAAKPAPPRQVACSGAFAADSSQVRLAQVYGQQNVVFDSVEGPKNTKLAASVLFPKDPTRRLEVLWNNETTRTGTRVIVINGRSGWTAPRGAKLGMPLPALEKINGKPFKLTGFGADGSNVADWQGGALTSLPGGCKMGMRLVADPRAPQDALAQVAQAKELQSSDPGVRAVRPAVAEILIGY